MSDPEYVYDARNGQGNYKGNWITYDIKASAKERKTVKAPRMKFFCNVDRNSTSNNSNPPPGYTFVGRFTTEQLNIAKADAIKLCLGDSFLGVASEPRYVNKYKRNFDPLFKNSCCMGLTNDSRCDPKWKFNSAECDSEARKYCKINQQDINKCGCMLSEEDYKKTKLLGPPECIDSRCAGNPNSYKTQDMLNRNCPNIVNCVIDQTNISDLKDSEIGSIQYEQNCGISLEDAIKQYEDKQKRINPEDGNSNSDSNGNNPPSSSFKFSQTVSNVGIIVGIIAIISGGILYTSNNNTKIDLKNNSE